MTAVAMCASLAEDDFARFYPLFMPMCRTILQAPLSEVRARAGAGARTRPRC